MSEQYLVIYKVSDIANYTFGQDRFRDQVTAINMFKRGGAPIVGLDVYVTDVFHFKAINDILVASLAGDNIHQSEFGAKVEVLLRDITSRISPSVNVLHTYLVSRGAKFVSNNVLEISDLKFD